MSKCQNLRELMNHRSTAKFEEIRELCERRIAEYEEKLDRSQQEKQRFIRQLRATLLPEVRLHRADIQQLLVQQERKSSLDQEEPEPSHIKKEEEEELLISQEGEQLHHLEEADVIKFSFTLVPVKSEEDEEKVQFSQLQNQSEVRKESESVSSSSTEQTERESDGEDCGGPEPARNTYPEIQQVWSLSMNQEESELLHIKEECGTRQDGEQLQDLEEADVTEFPFTLVPVRSEDDEDKVQSSQLHQSQSEENREAENLASSSTEQTETGAHVEDCGGPGPSRNLDPDSYLQPACNDKTSDSSESGDSEDDLKETREPHSSLNTPKNHDMHDSDMRCKTSKKSLSCSECGAAFKNKGDLSRHMKTHTGSKPFSCSVCGKSYTHNEKFDDHMKCNSGSKPFSCSICNKQFRRKDMVRHTTHTGEKPFSCSVCGNKFTVNGSLKIHMRIHTGEKLFSCSFVGTDLYKMGI
ncbi:hypothetical protein LDENG_00250820 [Lucifuga dentata]|nr:hypothetical protein LDENG_00250820 [Lucifuga dentata]